MSLILITGGARAGKSTFAEQLALHWGGTEQVCYVATAEPGDDEMRARIATHRKNRPVGWRTVEAPREVATRLESLSGLSASVVVIDCLTLLVSNVLLLQPESSGEDDVWIAVEHEVNGLIRFAAQSGMVVLVVTNEAGLGVVPATRLGRLFRDLLGRANQRLATEAGQVFLVVSGLALEIKSRAYRPDSGHDTLAFGPRRTGC
jgi:adenosylcobinamide kinase / adenosylcobinamide-phosphate guanylyltransferase